MNKLKQFLLGLIVPPSPTQSKRAGALISLCQLLNAAVMVLVSLFFFVIPGITVIRGLSDPNIRSAGIPRSAWGLHQSLSPKFEKWASGRRGSKRAAELSTSNISGTEWPLFGSVFYLWATESLQDVWEKDHSSSPIAPAVYAKGAIEAATSLVIDPAQANWVKIHWGENYLKTENVFYRMLIISALTSHARLTGAKLHLPLLKEQTDSLSAELNASCHGLLDDYPGECYPGDVLTAIAMIDKADKVLGTDHSAFVNRAIRGFQRTALDSRGLVPYNANAASGTPSSPSRGCGNSYVSLFSPGIWLEQAKKWYELYAQFFGKNAEPAPDSGSFRRICPARTGIWMWMLDRYWAVLGVLPVLLEWGPHVSTDTSNTPTHSLRNCWSPRGLCRTVHDCYQDCFPTPLMLRVSAKPAFFSI